MNKTGTRQAPKLRGDLPGLFCGRDLESCGIPRGRLKAMLRRGEVARIGRGLYRRCDASPSELETVAAVAKRIPRAIVCLLTALHVHGIGTQVPRKVWIAIDRKAFLPKASGLPVKIVRFSRTLLRYSIDTREVLGVPVRLTSPARTVVDCFRYRKKIGLDVALEALRDTLGSRKATVAELARVAQVCRMRTVMSPYLESMIS
ncbi:MAG: type IV toxin-antitoxin system AbiEi family antitoxin domain-containing protein [Geobacter sp.]|nr:type IV toxin-antitoxin system AbiEi family antitoxin domain-containing protein [Geobacter sp.]